MRAGYSLNDGEFVVQHIKRHWVDLMPALVSAAVLAVAAAAIAYLYGRYGSAAASYFPVAIPGAVVAIIVAVLLILAALIFVAGTWVYRQNYMLVTNLHLIKVEQNGLFRRQASQLSLARVQDVAGHRSGLFATLMNFGDVVVQSAGEQENFIFRNAPGPQELADSCLEAHERFLQEQKGAPATPAAPAAPATAAPAATDATAPTDPEHHMP